MRARNNATGRGASAIYKKAETIREDAPGLTPEQAFAKAMEKHPDLYTEYRRERLARVR